MDIFAGTHYMVIVTINSLLCEHLRITTDFPLAKGVPISFSIQIAVYMAVGLSIIFVKYRHSKILPEKG